MGVSGTTKLDYFEVPMLFMWTTAPPGAGRTTFQFFGGPAAAFKVSSKGSGSFQGESVDVDIPDEDISRVDLGAVIGAGVAFGRFTVDGRYTIGQTNLNSNDNDPANVTNRRSPCWPAFDSDFRTLELYREYPRLAVTFPFLSFSFTSIGCQPPASTPRGV